MVTDQRTEKPTRHIFLKTFCSNSGLKRHMLTHNRETNPMKCSGHELLATARETHSLLPMSGPRNQHAISALKHFVVIPASNGICLIIIVRQIRQKCNSLRAEKPCCKRWPNAMQSRWGHCTWG